MLKQLNFGAPESCTESPPPSKGDQHMSPVMWEVHQPPLGLREL